MKNLKYGTNGLIYKTETDGQIERTDLCLPSERVSKGGAEWGAGAADANCHTRMERQGPTVQHRGLYSISWDNS